MPTLAQSPIDNNLSMNKSCLFVALRSPNHGTSCCALGTIGKLTMSRGVSNWFHNVLTYGREVIEYWTNFPFTIYLNQNEIYSGIWTCSWYSWKALDEEEELIKVIWSFWDLRCKRYWILSKFRHWILN